MKMMIRVGLLMCLVLLAGCKNDGKSFSRYPSVAIPKYGQADYIRDLSDPKDERVYNAVCNLTPHAAWYGELLCAQDADVESEDYKNATAVYSVVRGTLGSKKPQIVAASLRFLQLFAEEYDPKNELLARVVQIERTEWQVQFEQISLLKVLVGRDSQLPESLLRRFLASPSWIVSRSAYDLVGQLNEDSLRQELVQAYRDAGDERERLILIQALGHQVRPTEARLFEQEVFVSLSPKIRELLSSVLLKNVNTPERRAWWIDHYLQFNSQERARLFSECNDLDLTCEFLMLGDAPDEEFMENLLRDLVEVESAEKRNDLLRLEQALLAKPQTGARWKRLKEEAEQARQRLASLGEELAPQAQEFRNEMRALMAKHEVPESQIETVWKHLSEVTKP